MGGNGSICNEDVIRECCTNFNTSVWTCVSLCGMLVLWAICLICLRLLQPIWKLRFQEQENTFANRKESEEAQTPKTGDIYISDTSSSTATKNFVRDFRKALTTITGVTAKEVSANYVKTLPDERVVCLILVCNNASRLHADIQQSLGYLENCQQSKTVLLILHVGKSASFDHGDICKSLRGVIHMEYDNSLISKYDIFRSDRNLEAFKQLKNLLPSVGNSLCIIL